MASREVHEAREELQRMYEQDVADGHGATLRVGEKHGKWKVDTDHWLWRPQDPKDEALIHRGSNNGFMGKGKVYVRSKKIADRLDLGFKI